MARPLRYVPRDAVVEVTARTLGSRFLLRPSPAVNDLIAGIIGRAQERYGVRIFALVVLSTHLHALLGVDDAAQLAAFMRYVLGNIAIEVGRHHGWRGRFWGRRYRAIVIADRQAQLDRMRYLLSNGPKEGLVERCSDLPGLTSVRVLTAGARMLGTWFDRTAELEARRRGEVPDPLKVETIYEVKHTPLPALAELEPEEYRKLIAQMVREVEEAAREDRARRGKHGVLGARRMLEQDPHAEPASTDTSCAPPVHASSLSVRRALLAAYQRFVDAFRSAASFLRRGLPAEFPEGAFPPPAPFVALTCPG